jgi:hypothetical protein
MAYQYMTGLPGFGSSGFCMMGPEELKKQRLTYIKYWNKRLTNDLAAIAKSAQ